MFKIVEAASDRLLGLIAPKAVAEAGVCACDQKESWYAYCFCSGGYVYTKYVRCDGCNLIVGSCNRTSVRC